MPLGVNCYGKGEIRRVKVVRTPGRHQLRDLTVHVALEGEFEAAHLAGDNTDLLATDTMRNTVYALAKTGLGGSIEAFAQALANHFVAAGPSVTRARGPDGPAAPPIDRASAIAAVRHLPLPSKRTPARRRRACASSLARRVRAGARRRRIAAASWRRLAADALRRRPADGRPRDRPRHARTNYFTGDSPADWQTAVRTFGGVRYGSVWPGIDVAFHGTRQRLEYDYILSPGADPVGSPSASPARGACGSTARATL